MLAAASVTTTTTHEAVACGRRFSLSSCKVVVVVVVVYSLVLWFKDMSFSLICLIRKKNFFIASCVFTKFVKIYPAFSIFFFVKRYLAFCLFLYLFGKIFFSWKRRRISLFRNSLYNRGSSSSNCWFPTWRIVRHLALPTERPSLIDKWYL